MCAVVISNVPGLPVVVKNTMGQSPFQPGADSIQDGHGLNENVLHKVVYRVLSVMVPLVSCSCLVRLESWPVLLK